MLSRIKSVATNTVAFVKDKPNTCMAVGYMVGSIFTPIAATLFALFYTGWTLGGKAGEEWNAELDEAIDSLGRERGLTEEEIAKLRKQRYEFRVQEALRRAGLTVAEVTDVS